MPPHWPVFALAAEVQVRIGRPTPELPAALAAEVARLWRQELSARPALFNGTVFSADTVTPTLITGHWTEYRRVIAQMRAPELHAALGVRSLAVCGVLHCRDGVVFGRREAGAVYQAGLWQLPPAGSVDAGAARADGAIDLRHQLFTELREELGLQPDQITRFRPICAVEHPDSHVLDLGIALETALGAAELLAAHAAAGNGEYDALRIVPDAEIPSWLADLGETVVPPARAFLAGHAPAGAFAPS